MSEATENTGNGETAAMPDRRERRRRRLDAGGARTLPLAPGASVEGPWMAASPGGPRASVRVQTDQAE